MTPEEQEELLEPKMKSGEVEKCRKRKLDLKAMKTKKKDKTIKKYENNTFKSHIITKPK